MQQDPRMARQVQAIYNYQVGQKAAVGKLLLVVGLAAGAVFFLATFLNTVERIVIGISAH